MSLIWGYPPVNYPPETVSNRGDGLGEALHPNSLRVLIEVRVEVEVCSLFMERVRCGGNHV